MRKYQQLLLLCLTICSVSVLLIYKSENNKLKYVLQVVNFFGRNDSAIILDHSNRQDDFNFAYPLPIWQSIDKDFHVYATYWNRDNELVAGGEAISLVVGKRGVVNFRCALLYDGGAKSIKGKFHFMRNDLPENRNMEFSQYNFFCSTTKNFGTPESVVFVDVTSDTRTAHKLRLRYVKEKGSNILPAPEIATVCVNLLNFNTSLSFYRKETNVIQFFLHHYILGVNHFLVYGSDELPRHIVKFLLNKGLHLHLLPFNFPFASENATEIIRKIIEADCIIRNTNLARHTILLEPNEFVYSIAKFDNNKSITHHHSSDINRFELLTLPVCLDRNDKSLLVDNHMYDPEERVVHRIFLHRLQAPLSFDLDKDSSHIDISVSVSKAQVHQYSECVHVGNDGLHDWRSTLRSDFMKQIRAEREAITVLIS